MVQFYQFFVVCFNILSINGCQLGLGVGLLRGGLLQEKRSYDNTLKQTQSETLGQCPLFSRSCGDRGFSLFRARLVADALRPATALHRLRKAACQLHGSESLSAHKWCNWSSNLKFRKSHFTPLGKKVIAFTHSQADWIVKGCTQD